MCNTTGPTLGTTVTQYRVKVNLSIAAELSRNKWLNFFLSKSGAKHGSPQYVWH